MSSSSRTRSCNSRIRLTALPPLGTLPDVGIVSHAAVLRLQGRLAVMRTAAGQSACGSHHILQILKSDL